MESGVSLQPVFEVFVGLVDPLPGESSISDMTVIICSTSFRKNEKAARVNQK